MTIEEAKAKLSQAYHLIEEVDGISVNELDGSLEGFNYVFDFNYVFGDIDNAMLALDAADDDIELLHERRTNHERD
ncbi:hypothetical protein [Lactobacillus sp. 3B(2020)]|uniref:hypothetical protein n=1 Tax=Lactobacillus sp. 3B(2020) TaxID=2695882 RepID=UPI0015DEA332|nr:hypothetical protein [Lactobacillus sp. 3B(2020)]QLL70245.1 hypothetical protein GTO83_06700 [Lactobacillus sp. 3B(2020)]